MKGKKAVHFFDNAFYFYFDNSFYDYFTEFFMVNECVQNTGSGGRK